jgi:hypothetical protein
MKRLLSWSAFGLVIVLAGGCAEPDEQYVDISTGKGVELVKDETSGLMVNKETGKPLDIYINTKTHDTVYGKTGKVINGHIIKMNDNLYVYDQDEKLKIGDEGDVKYKDGDYKVKVEADGDNKTKSGDTKIKSDADKDKRKVKND